jgi:plastocyanin
MVVLVFAAIASAQDATEQSSSEQNTTGTDQTQSPMPSQQQATPSEQATSDQNTPTVRITPTAFDPAQVEAASGTPVTFLNGDTVPHTVSLDGLFDSPEIPAGSSYPITLEGTGTVTYHDKANPEMQGTITLGEASQGEATTPEEGSTTNPSPTGEESTG